MNSPRHTVPPATTHDLLRHDYLSLRTSRADGSTVATPMWFALDETGIVVRTPITSAKVRRIRANARVAVQSCDWQGRSLGDVWIDGRARILEGEDAEAANRTLHDRYGWKWNLVPMIPVPGVKSAHTGLSLRDRFRLVRHRALWPNSVIVHVEPDEPGQRAMS